MLRTSSDIFITLTSSRVRDLVLVSGKRQKKDVKTEETKEQRRERGRTWVSDKPKVPEFDGFVSSTSNQAPAIRRNLKKTNNYE